MRKGIITVISAICLFACNKNENANNELPKAGIYTPITAAGNTVVVEGTTEFIYTVTGGVVEAFGRIGYSRIGVADHGSIELSLPSEFSKKFVHSYELGGTGSIFSPDGNFHSSVMVQALPGTSSAIVFFTMGDAGWINIIFKYKIVK